MINTSLRPLFNAVRLNAHLQLKNAMVMAPMTRCMANEKGEATQAMADYYAKRADAGLIISEGIVVDSLGTGYRNVPGLFNQAQVDSFKPVTNAVHQRGGKIVAQIWHVGRVSHPKFLDGSLPISASATQMSGPVKRERGIHYGKSRAATIEEIHAMVAQFKQAARNAIRAGFDGVEIHGANGYLVDQFLHFKTNLRQDKYGGSIANMTRFPFEVVDAVGQAIGFERVGIRLSPAAYINEMEAHEGDQQVFKHFLQRLDELPLAYIHTGNFDDKDTYESIDGQTMTEFLKANSSHPIIAAGSYTPEDGASALASGHCNLVAFGRPFIANPNLVNHLKNEEDIVPYDVEMLKALT